MLIFFHGDSYYRTLIVYDQTELLIEGQLFLKYFIEKLNEVFLIDIDIPDDITAAYWTLRYNDIDKIITLLPDIFCKQPVLRIELGDLYRQISI